MHKSYLCLRFSDTTELWVWKILIISLKISTTLMYSQLHIAVDLMGNQTYKLYKFDILKSFFTNWKYLKDEITIFLRTAFIKFWVKQNLIYLLGSRHLSQLLVFSFLQAWTIRTSWYIHDDAMQQIYLKDKKTHFNWPWCPINKLELVSYIV